MSIFCACRCLVTNTNKERSLKAKQTKITHQGNRGARQPRGQIGVTDNYHDVLGCNNLCDKYGKCMNEISDRRGTFDANDVRWN